MAACYNSVSLVVGLR
uniref:Uncharacterized protein n=1 Tax=Arundo donax TaxID=35708 RepID=A0A0A8ZHK4_ARUDO